MALTHEMCQTQPQPAWLSSRWHLFSSSQTICMSQQWMLQIQSVTQCNLCIHQCVHVGLCVYASALRERKRAYRDMCADKGLLYCMCALHLCHKEHQITCKCVHVCAQHKAGGGGSGDIIFRNNEANRQACIKYTHMDARTHKLNKASSLSALFIFTSVTNNQEDINNPNWRKQSKSHTHARTHTQQT